MLDWFVNPNHGPIVIAQERGYFKQQGLKVNIQEPADPSTPPKLVAAGKVDMAISYQPSLTIDVAAGLPLIRSATLIATPLNTLMVLDNGKNDNLGDLKGKKIGIPKEYRMEGTDPEILKSWDDGIAWLKDAGAEIVDISLPHTRYALPAYYIIAPAEASSNLARYDGVRYGLRDLPEGAGLQDMYAATRAEGFGDEVKRRVLIGTYVLSAGYYDAYYIKAQKIRTLIAQDFKQAYEKVDVLLTPTAPSDAFGIGEKTDDPLSMYLNDVFTVTVNLAGLPGISLPAGLSARGLPLGLQLIGRAFDEETLLRTAGVLEEAAGFNAEPDAWWRA
mgnify:CR=1 FL=1